MSAATESILTSSRPGIKRNLSMKASSKVYGGTLAALTTAGYVRAAVATNTTDKIVGIADAEVDNSSGSNGDLKVDVLFGIFELAYTGTAPTIADIGKPVYVSDDQTVTLDPTSAPPIVGVLHDVSATSGFCWVEITAQPPSPTQVTLTSTNGTAAGAADLAALKAEAEKIGDDVRAIHAALVNKGILSA